MGDDANVSKLRWKLFEILNSGMDEPAKHDTLAHVAGGGFGVFAEGCRRCEADGVRMES